MKWICGDSVFEVKVINCNKPIIKRITDEKIIISIVSNVFDVSVRAMTSGEIRRGVRVITDARHTAISFLEAKTKLKIQAIGELFHKHHSLVIYARKNVDKLLTDKQYKKKYLECDQLIMEYLQNR